MTKFDETAKKICKHNKEIVTLWLKTLQKTLKIDADEVFPTDSLLNGVPTLLDGVAEVVNDKRAISNFEPGREIYNKAKELGELRESQGFKVDQVINEYCLLKEIILNFCNKECPQVKDELYDLIERINLSLDKILIITIETYFNRYTKTLQILAVTDDLTRVKNHRFLLEQLRLELERSKRYNRPTSLLMIDIDFFKQYNDVYGHLQGDEILKIYASVLESSSRKSDIVARYGGDEFCVVLPDADTERARRLGRRLQAEIEKLEIAPVVFKKKYNITISLGLATFPDDAATFEELIDKADIALYEAKKQGGNNVTSYSEATSVR